MTVKSFPTISVVTPSYNQGGYLEQTILSVLDQEYPRLEYIIIDGNSSDNSIDIISKYEKYLKYWVSEEDFGQSHAINKGFRNATGELFIWLNSDDKFCLGALRTVAEIYANNPEVGAIVGSGIMRDEEGRQLRYDEPFTVTRDALCEWNHTFFWQPSCFFTKSAWSLCGPLNESLRYAMDLELWFRIASKFSFFTTKALLSESLKHNSAKTTLAPLKTAMEVAFVISRHGGIIPAVHCVSDYLRFKLQVNNSTLQK